MAATESHDTTAHRRRTPPHPSADELLARLDEEIGRAERHGTALSALIVSLDPDRLADEEGCGTLPEQALAYMGDALRRQLRRFDRIGRLSSGELLVLLPGADQLRAEIVARRALGRLREIKLELGGHRHAIGVCIGLEAWSKGTSAEHLLARIRATAWSRRPHEPAGG